jgi:hypothetical protein
MKARNTAFVLVIFIFLLAGCKPQAAAPAPTQEVVVVDPGKPSIVIVSPPSESSFPAQSRVMIQSTAADSNGGISRVELFVDGSLIRSSKTPEDTPQEQYTLLQPWVPAQPGEYVLSVAAFRSDGTASNPAKITIIITEAEAQPTVEDQPCQVMASTRINIRTGPGTNYGILDILPLGETVPVKGKNAESTWWQIDYKTITGWVFAELTYPEGSCEDIQVVNVKPPSTSADETPAAPELEATGVQTPQSAPSDPDLNPPLIIPVNLTASVSDHVSYPEGDRVDKVNYDVSGLNPGDKARLIITSVCAGSGLEHIKISSGGQTFGCTQPIVNREVTVDSKSGTITIEAVGGTGTNVFWVLTGTVTVIPALPLP